MGILLIQNLGKELDSHCIATVFPPPRFLIGWRKGQKTHILTTGLMT